jgi:hypothetical protein
MVQQIRDRLLADLRPERAGTIHHEQKKETPTLVVRAKCPHRDLTSVQGVLSIHTT